MCGANGLLRKKPIANKNPKKQRRRSESISKSNALKPTIRTG